jgi:hypothetical protein
MCKDLYPTGNSEIYLVSCSHYSETNSVEASTRVVYQLKEIFVYAFLSMSNIILLLCTSKVVPAHL